MSSRSGPGPGPGDFDVDTPVLVLRRSLGPFQHCALGIARSLGRVGVPVFSAVLHSRECLVGSRYLTGSLDLDANLPPDRWAEQLMALAPRFSGAILLPIDDLAAVAVGDHQHELARHFRLPAAPPGIQRRLASKRAMHELCLELGLSTPPTASPTTEEEFLHECAERGYPVVIKRGEAWARPRDPDAPSVVIAGTPEQARRAYARMESDERPQIMVQDFIPGGSEDSWMFNGYFDVAGQCRCAFTGRKLRQRGPRTGPTTLGECVPNGAVETAALTFLRAINYQGIVDMGLRYDRRDGSYNLYDINPRLGSTFRLFTAENGIDVVRAMHLDLTSRSVPPSTCPSGRRWLDERSDVVTLMQLAREGSLRGTQWLRSWHGVDEAAWWARDDRQPFWAMCHQSALPAVRRVMVRG